MWAVPMVGARTWVSSGWREDGANTGVPLHRERESEREGKWSTALTRRAYNAEREREAAPTDRPHRAEGEGE
jgi:hypothetical protein